MSLYTKDLELPKAAFEKGGGRITLILALTLNYLHLRMYHKHVSPVWLQMLRGIVLIEGKASCKLIKLSNMTVIEQGSDLSLCIQGDELFCVGPPSSYQLPPWEQPRLPSYESVRKKDRQREIHQMIAERFGLWAEVSQEVRNFCQNSLTVWASALHHVNAALQPEISLWGALDRAWGEWRPRGSVRWRS